MVSPTDSISVARREIVRDMAAPFVVFAAAGFGVRAEVDVRVEQSGKQGVVSAVDVCRSSSGRLYHGDDAVADHHVLIVQYAGAFEDAGTTDRH